MARITIKAETNSLSLVTLSNLGTIGGAVSRADIYGNLANTARINLVVDPVNGESPPVGTVVTSQAEYDALGAPLKYINDVYRVLALYKGYFVHVSLVTGTHTPDPDGAGVGIPVLIAEANSQAFWPYARLGNTDGGDPDYINLYIHFEGAGTAVVDPAQAGTFTASGYISTLQKAAGTWAPHTLAGKWAYITTGPLSGTRYIIVDNTATELKVWGYGTGSNTFEVNEPGAAVESSNYVSAYLLGPKYTITRFTNVKFGVSPSNYMAPLFTDNAIEFYDCQINTTSTLLPETIPLPLPIVGQQVTFNDTFLSSELIVNPYAIVIATSSVFMAYNRALTTKPMSSVYLSTCLFVSGAGSDFLANLQGGAGTINGCYIVSLAGGDSGIRVDDFQGTVYAEIHGCAVAAEANAGRVVSGLSLSGDGNAVGWRLSNGSTIRAYAPDNLLATTEIQVDGADHTYSELTGPGSYIEGPYKSLMQRLT